MILNLEALKKALLSLEAVFQKANDSTFVASLDEATRQGLRSGAVKHFEFTYELCWKLMQRWLEFNQGQTDADGLSRRELFRRAAEHQLISDPLLWWQFHEARNLTSHTYNEPAAQKVLAAVADFIVEAKRLLAVLEAHND